MKRLALLAAGAAALSCTLNLGAAGDRPSMFGSLAPSIAARVSSGHRMLEYCPDNTCERFITSSRVPARALADFAYLYLATVSGYTALQHFKAAEAPQRVSELLSKYSTACAAPDHPQPLGCVLRALQRKHHINIQFVRYDEGQENIVPLVLETEFRRTGIK